MSNRDKYNELAEQLKRINEDPNDHQTARKIRKQLQALIPHNPDTTIVKNSLKTLGAAGAGATFSGGNDEGGFDDAQLLPEDFDFESKDASFYHTEYPSFDPYGYGTTLSYDEAIVAARLLQGLDQWGSFAGEYHVNGTVLLTPDGKLKVDYNESVESWESGYIEY